MSGGTCRLCQCTDQAPCAGGCAWTDEQRNFCTACLEAQVLAERMVGILVTAGARARPFVSFSADLQWADLVGEQEQLLVMAVRAVLDRVEQTLADELNEQAVGALRETDRIHAFLLERCPRELVDETSIGDVVLRLLEPHVGGRRIVIPKGASL